MAEKMFDVSHEVERKTRQLSVVLGVFGAVVLIALGVAIVLSLPREVLAVQSGLLLCVGLSYYLLRQGRVRAAVVLFLLSWLAFPLGSLASSSADMMLFMMPYLLIPTIVVAGMLLSPGGAFVALVALTLGYLGAIVARGGWREIGSVWASGVAGAAPVGVFYLLLPLLSGVMLAALSWLSGRGMNGALEQTAQSARVARAQLDASISMVADLVVASARVAGLADELTTTMGYIRTGTEEIAEATGRVAVGAGDQAREVERISESSAQLAEATRRIASDTHETSIAAAESERLIEATATMIETLRRRLKAVDGVARLVDKLADQTNLLALNASIEAARAGAAGAGFAVVAEEMQDLAARSAVSVRDIGTATQEVHRSLTPVLASVVEVQDEARRSQQLSEQVAVMTVQQEQSSDAMVVAVGEIAVVAEQNAVATERIAASVEEQLASIEQLVEATQRLSEIAGDLRTIVAGQLNQGDGQGLRARLCPNFADSPILEELCYEEASGALIRQYCMGDFDVCARKQFRDAKKPVPSGLWPDGTIAEER